MPEADDATTLLRDWLERNRVVTGGRMPAERTLATALGCSRRQIRAAIAQLEGEGAIKATSDRIRVAVGRSLPRTGSLDRTVVILASLNDVPTVDPLVGAGTYLRAHRGIVAELQQRGLQVLTLPIDGRGVDHVCRLMMMRRPLGFILLFDAARDPGGRAVLDSARAAQVPAVVCGDELTPDELATCACDRVGFDHTGAVAALVGRLVARGRRHLVGLTARNPATAQTTWWLAQEAGLRIGCAAHGLTYRPSIPILWPSEGMPIAEQRFQLPRLCAGYLVEHLRGPHAVDGILCSIDAYVPEVAEAVRLFGREPGRDADLVGYDNRLDLPVLAA